MSRNSDVLAGIVTRQYDRVWFFDSIYKTYVRIMPDGEKLVTKATAKKILGSHPDVETVTSDGQGCITYVQGYKAVRHYKHPASHAWDAFAALTGPQAGIFMAIVGGTLLLAGQSVKYWLTGSFN